MDVENVDGRLSEGHPVIIAGIDSGMYLEFSVKPVALVEIVPLPTTGSKDSKSTKSRVQKLVRVLVKNPAEVTAEMIAERKRAAFIANG